MSGRGAVALGAWLQSVLRARAAHNCVGLDRKANCFLQGCIAHVSFTHQREGCLACAAVQPLPAACRRHAGCRFGRSEPAAPLCLRCPPAGARSSAPSVKHQQSASTARTALQQGCQSIRMRRGSATKARSKGAKSTGPMAPARPASTATCCAAAGAWCDAARPCPAACAGRQRIVSDPRNSLQVPTGFSQRARGVAPPARTPPDRPGPSCRKQPCQSFQTQTISKPNILQTQTFSKSKPFHPEHPHPSAQHGPPLCLTHPPLDLNHPPIHPSRRLFFHITLCLLRQPSLTMRRSATLARAIHRLGASSARLSPAPSHLCRRRAALRSATGLRLHCPGPGNISATRFVLRLPSTREPAGVAVHVACSPMLPMPACLPAATSMSCCLVSALQEATGLDGPSG